MYGPIHWATGITVSANERPDGAVRWGATVAFYDGGFVDTEDVDAGDISTEGEIRTKYCVASTETADGLTVAIDTIKADANRLGIEFRGHFPGSAPALYVNGDGEWPDVWLPENWRGRLAEQARRLGWRTYGDPTGQGHDRGTR
ncbi:hypothetical protein CcI49_23100 [Frankia sp. CcI49]|uniref:hypothetical protein n=1 Tax=Frankia sp. CcI49 TaxID=1745382 RepID=UPI0009762FA8|nr:hypothetical protein [Frankia sp. CcI49]ONH58345.1 hypothetical protein CcI49_23100 [Frankia sp. CcI49]